MDEERKISSGLEETENGEEGLSPEAKRIVEVFKKQDVGVAEKAAVKKKKVEKVEPGKDNFKLYKKWFWVGIAMAILNPLAGLVFGVVLFLEKDHQKEGMIISVVAVVWSLLGYYVLSPMMIRMGLMQSYTVVD